MKHDLSKIKDIKLYSLNLLINERKTPLEVASIAQVSPIVVIGWLHRHLSPDNTNELKITINKLKKDISNLKGNNCL